MSVYRSSGGGRVRRSAARSLLLLAALSLGMLARASAQTAIDPALTEAIKAFETAMRDKNMARAIAAWQFETPELGTAEQANLMGTFSSNQVAFNPDAPVLAADGQSAVTLGTVAQISEPRGAVEQWSLTWRKTAAGWRIVSKEVFGGIDGLVHLSLQNRGFVAAGQSIELEDFTLKMLEGTFFLNTPEAGPTALTFVGKARVTFKPRPVTERGQMKIFAKSEILDDEVTRFFLRIHPADLYRTLKPGTFVDDPLGPSRLARANEFFESHKSDSFILDAQIAGAPWWLLPGLSDALVVFESRRFGTLTLTLSSFEGEGVSLFNRANNRQICAYPRDGAGPEAEEGPSPFDVIHHELAVSLNPETFDLTGRDTITIDVNSPVNSFRFSLDDDLQVRSIRSKEGGRHLFFRVRGYNSVLVSMGSLSDRVGRLNLTVDYIGRLPAGTVESEILMPEQDVSEEPAFFIDQALIYSKRRWFYPQVGDEDYATSNIAVTVPAEWTVLSGGTRTETSDRATRTVTHAQKSGGKYLAFLVARMVQVASEKEAPLAFEAWSQNRARRDGLRLVASLKAAARFYAENFGPLPYSSINLALIEAPVPGGHSPPGLVIVQQRPALMGGALKDDPATFYDIPAFFLAHELAHQWWGHGVTPRTYRDRWVSEGFAQYAAALWTRESLGEETFIRVLKKLVTWSRRLTTAGPVDLGNRVGHIQNNAQAHRAVVYDKGALVLDMVRRLIGDEAFRRSLVKLQGERRFSKVSSEMVRRAFESEAKIDLDPLWEVFVRNTAIPSMRIERHGAGQDLVVEGYSGPLPVTVRVGDKKVDLVVTGRLTIPNAPAAARVELDPDGISLVTASR